VQPTKKAVSRAQYRLFANQLQRVQNGELSTIGMTEEELLAALEGVEYDTLPERAGQAASKSKPKAKAPAKPAAPPSPPPPPLADGVLSLEAYRARHPEKAPVSVDAQGPGRVLSFEGYLRRHPERKNWTLPPEIGREWFPALFKRAKVR
jgi:hypothetical protein